MMRTLIKFTLVLLIALVLLPVLPAQVQAQGCSGSPAPRLVVGQSARVTVGQGVGNNLRASASQNATVLGVISDGEVFTVLSGPTCADNYNWWQISRWNGQTGWTVEGAGADYWVEPWPTAGAPLAVGKLPAPETGQLAFLSTRTATNVTHLFVMRADGSNVLDLTPAATTHVGEPVWSPDGTRIAYTLENDIYVVGLDGLNPVNLTPTTEENFGATWSPDGTRIAFAGSLNNNPEIFVVPVVGGTPVNLTNNAALDYGPAWSPDGTRIAFNTDRDGSSEIYTMSAADGSTPVRLTTNTTDDLEPVWSPDGKKIAYLSQDDKNTDIFTMNADGSQPVNVTNSEGRDIEPVWSPDSSRIAYVAETTPGTSRFDLFSVRADGTQRLQFTTDGAVSTELSWSPDGDWLTFVSNTSGNLEVYLLRSSGAGLVNLTNSPAVDSAPVWAPRIAPLPGAPAVPTVTGGTPASVPGSEDLLLIYDPAVPVFTLINNADQRVNLEPLSFTGAGVTVVATIWQTEFLASPLNDFQAGACLMLWRFGLPDQPTPAECGTARQGWIANESSVFWTQGTFTVSYNGVVIQTCDVASKRCVVDLP